MKFYVYILRCANNIYYTGITSNIKKRFLEHQNGQSAFTKSRRPLVLVYYEVVESRFLARKREIIIKDMSQKRKFELIKKFTSSVTKLNEKRE